MEKHRPRHVNRYDLARRAYLWGQVRWTVGAAVVLTLLGAVFYNTTHSTSQPVDNALPAVAGTYTCVVVETVGGFRQDCTLVPSSTPPPSPSPTTPSPTPTTPQPSPTTPPPTTTVPPSPSPTLPTGTPSPTPTTLPPGCPVPGTNVPGAADPWGGCFPGPGNTGVPSGTTLTNYTGPCTITAAGTVIDHKTVACATLDIRASGVVISMSLLNGTDVVDSNSASASFTISDSTVVNGARDQCLCIGDHNFTATRVEVRGGNRSVYCASTCTVAGSWLHGQILDVSLAQHGSGLREEQFTTATHNTFECSYPIVNDATSLGCSAPQNGYADFAPIHDNTNTRNLYVSTPQASCSTCDGPAHTNSSYCSYGGNSAGKPFSSDPTNGTHIQYISNVFQRGPTGKCGEFETIGDYSKTKVGNVATGNIYDDGTAVPASQIG